MSQINEKDTGPESDAGGYVTVRNGMEDQILRTVRALRYGSVEVVVHDGRVVQVEKRERMRFPETK